MTCRAVLFDLDGTLIDTSTIKGFREKRDWNGCIIRAANTVVYDGVHELLEELVLRGVNIGVVTVSISNYANVLLKHHNLPYHTLVAYHDVTHRKPHPEGFEKALRAFQVAPSNALGVGDEIRDVAALSAAGIVSVRAGWNAANEPDSRWSATAKRPADVLTLANFPKRCCRPQAM